MQLGELERRMRPGGWVARPLLARNESLSARLQDDAQRLKQLGTTAPILGKRLAELLAGASTSDWFRPRGQGDFEVELHRRRGFITCPWASEEYAKCVVGEGSRATANEFVVRNRKSRRQLTGFEISAHLIRDHAFFGGVGTAFRIEPEDLAALLNS
jgi:hypothetical protein